jgi:hypothetical protein
MNMNQLTFRKSSYSGNRQDCVECASTAWHTSSYTSAHGYNCVEVSEGPLTAIRDSKNPDHGALSFTAGEWCAFLDAAKRGSL